MKQIIAKKLNQTGTTLVELLLYLGLVTILLGVLTQMFVGILDTQLSSESTSTVEQDSRYILTRLTYDIHRADTVNVPAFLGEESSNLQMIINGISYSYSVENGNLILSRSGQNYQLNSYNSTISDVSFQRIGNTDGDDTFRIFYTTTSKIRVNNIYESKEVHTTVGLR